MNVYFMKLDYLFANKALLFVACKRDLKPWDSFELRSPCLYNIIVINIRYIAHADTKIHTTIEIELTLNER